MEPPPLKSIVLKTLRRGALLALFKLNIPGTKNRLGEISEAVRDEVKKNRVTQEKGKLNE